MSLIASLIAPGRTIGIVGGGQLGRMMAMAAARLGYRVHVFCPEPDCPASHLAIRHHCADYEDRAALDTFAATIDVATIEFENVPLATVERLAARVPMRPQPSVLRIAQDRILEKRFLNDISIATAPWHAILDANDLDAALAAIGRPAILKTSRLGYDGKGQRKIETAEDLTGAWHAFRQVPCVLEGYIGFEREISVIVARGLDGSLAIYDAVENEHKDHILATTRVPARVPPAVAAAAQEMAARVATRLDLVGLVAVEMFVTRDGRVLANEIAPRPHNSGHWSIEAASTDQFEQVVRAICGLPLGSTERRFDATMENLIGADIERWPDLITRPDARLHLYGKTEIRPGRKMGHVTWLRPRR